MPELNDTLHSLTDEKCDFSKVSRVKPEPKGGGSVSANTETSSGSARYNSSLTGYAQHTDVSSLCILHLEQASNIYDNLVAEEKQKLEDLLLVASQNKENAWQIERYKEFYSS